MSYDYSENILVQNSAGDLLHDELGWDVRFAYNTEVLGKNGTFGRRSTGKRCPVTIASQRGRKTAENAKNRGPSPRQINTEVSK